MTAGVYASCRGMGLTSGRYACKDDDWNEDYVGVVDVMETAKAFTLKLDVEESAKLWGKLRGLSWEEFDELTQEDIVERRRRHFEYNTPFKGGKLVVKKDGTRHPLRVQSEFCFLLNPYWGGTLYEYHRI